MSDAMWWCCRLLRSTRSPRCRAWQRNSRTMPFSRASSNRMASRALRWPWVTSARRRRRRRCGTGPPTDSPWPAFFRPSSWRPQQPQRGRRPARRGRRLFRVERLTLHRRLLPMASARLHRRPRGSRRWRPCPMNGAMWCCCKPLRWTKQPTCRAYRRSFRTTRFSRANSNKTVARASCWRWVISEPRKKPRRCGTARWAVSRLPA